MENTPSDKDRFKQVIEAYAVAKATGNSIIIQQSLMLLEQWLLRLPDTFPELVTPPLVTEVKPVNPEEPAQP